MSAYHFEDSANALSGSVFVVLGVPGQKFQDLLSTVRQLGKHVGEGAPPVNGKVEFPLSVTHNEEREELLLSLSNWSQRKYSERERVED